MVQHLDSLDTVVDTHLQEQHNHLVDNRLESDSRRRRRLLESESRHPPESDNRRLEPDNHLQLIEDSLDSTPAAEIRVAESLVADIHNLAVDLLKETCVSLKF